MEQKYFRRMPKEQRDALRRQQIVEAAGRCVARLGFHQASLALIATEASMSVGQIYRYFRNKDEIIAAIVQGLTERHGRRLAPTDNDDQPDMVETLMSALVDDSGARAHERRLLLEMHSEAARNPVVGEILQQGDAHLHACSAQALRADSPDLTSAEIAAITEYLATFSAGRLLRMDRTDPAVLPDLMRLHRRVMHFLLSHPTK